MSEPRAAITVYHDRSCSICRAEMEELKAIDQENILELVDCSASGFSDVHAADARLDQDTLMRAMFIRTADGEWLQGPDAFAHLYGRLGIPGMAKFWGSRTLRPLVSLGYRLFAMTRRFLSYLGVASIVRWWVRREARRAAQRTQHCTTRRKDPG